MATLDVTQLPTFQAQTDLPQADMSASPASAAPQSNAFVSGLTQGYYGLRAGFKGAGAAIERAVGLDSLADESEKLAQGWNQAATTAARPDIEDKGLFGNPLSYLAYKAGQIAPTVVGVGLTSLAAPEIAAGTGLARAAGALPRFLGGAGSTAIAAAEAGEAGAGAALAGSTGAGLLKNVAAGTAFMAPQSAGEIYNEHVKHGDSGRGAALTSLAEGLPIGAIQSLGFGPGASGVFRASAESAATFAVGSGLQSVAETAADPNMSLGDRAQAAISAAGSGAVMGGFFGAIHGLMPKRNPTSISNDQLQQGVDLGLGQFGPDNAVQGPPQPGRNIPEYLQQARQSLIDSPPEGAPEVGNEYSNGIQPTLPEGRVGYGTETPSLVDNLPDRQAANVPDYLQQVRQKLIEQPPEGAPDRPSELTEPPTTALQQKEALLEGGSGTSPTEAERNAALVEGQERTRGILAMDDEFKKSANQKPDQQPLPFLDEEMRPLKKTSSDNLKQLAARVNGRPIEAVASEVSEEAAIRQALRDAGQPVEDATPVDLQQAGDVSSKIAQNNKNTLFAQFGDDGKNIGQTGVMRDWITQSDATSAPDLFNKMQDELNAKSKVSTTAGFKRMAREIGLLGDNNKPMDIDAERARIERIDDPAAKADAQRDLDAAVQVREQASQLRPNTGESTLGEVPVNQKPADVPPAAEPARADAAPEQPKSVADQVLAKAQELTGGNGGTLSIAKLREAMPNLAKDDFENALRTIHGNDSDNLLSRGPKGQRNDGIKLGEDRVHQIEVEAREPTDGVQEPSAGDLGAEEQPEPVRDTQEGNEGDGSAAGAQSEQEGSEVIQPSTSTGGRGEQQARVAQDRQTAGFTSFRQKSLARQRVSENPQTGAMEMPADAVGVTRDDAINDLAKGDTSATPTSNTDPFLAKQTVSEVGPSDSFNGRAHFNDIVKGLRPTVSKHVHFVDKYEDLPAEVRSAQEAAGYGRDDVHASYYNGEVHLRGDLLHDTTAIEDALSHEVLGHYGTRDRFSDQDAFVSSMGKIYDDLGGRDGIEKVARKFGIWEDHGSTAGLSKYLPDGELSNEQKANFVDELISHRAETSKGQKGVSTLIGTVKTVIANMLRKAGLNSFADRFNSFNAAAIDKWIADSKRALITQTPVDRLNLLTDGSQVKMPDFMAARTSIKDQLAGTTAFSGVGNKLYDFVQRTPVREVQRLLRKGVQQFKSNQGIVRDYDGDFNGLLRKHSELNPVREVAEGYHNELAMPVQRMNALLQREAPQAFDKLSDLLSTSSLNGIDVFKPWEKQTWLHDRPNSNLLKAEYDRMTALKVSLSQPAGKNGAVKAGTFIDQYRNIVAKNEATIYAHNINEMKVVANTIAKGEIPFFEQRDPTREYTQRTDLRGNVQGSRDFYYGAHGDMMEAVQKYLANKKVDLDTLRGDTPEENLSTDVRNRIDNYKMIQDQFNSIKDRVNNIEQAPYLHLGRTGNYGVSFDIKKNEAGTAADQNAVDAIYKHLKDNNFNDVMLNAVNGNNSVYIKLDKLDQAYRLRKLLDDPNMAEHVDPTVQPWAGPADADQHVRILPRQLQQVRDTILAQSNAKGDTLRQMTDELNRFFINGSSLNSSSRLMARREGVQGFSKDMAATSAKADQIMARSISALNVAGEKSALGAEIMKAASDAGRTSDTVKATRMMDTANFYLKNNVVPAIHDDLFDTLRGVAHTFYLGGSPGYALMNIGQSMTLGIPQLAKKYGYAKATASWTKAFADTTKIMGALAADSAERNAKLFKGEYTESIPGLSGPVFDRLRKGGMTDEKVKYLEGLVNNGTLDFGNYTRVMTGDNNGRQGAWGKLGQGKALLNGMAQASETYGRLLVALAARDLHSSNPAKAGSKFANPLDYGADAVKQAMFEWGSGNSPRIMSAEGKLGAAGPLMFQFHSFGPKLFEKLYSETASVFNGATPEIRKEGLKFMAGHLAAVMATSGAMGMPFFAWSSAAATKLSGLFNDGEDYDVQSHFRTFLSSMFGKEMGEVLSHGLPTQAGVDLTRWGDKDLLPFSNWMEDRRKLEDSIPATLAQSYGSSASMGINFLTMARDISEGRVMEGMAKGMPTFMRNFVRAYQMSDQGYVNGKGETLPVDATTADIMRQALGITNADKEEYNEKSRAVAGMVEDRKYRSSLIKSRLAAAYMKGDTSGIQSWQSEMQKYDQDPSHAGMPISPSFPQYLAARRQAVAYSQASGAPLNVRPKDRPAFNLVDY